MVLCYHISKCAVHRPKEIQWAIAVLRIALFVPGNHIFAIYLSHLRQKLIVDGLQQKQCPRGLFTGDRILE